MATTPYTNGGGSATEEERIEHRGWDVQQEEDARALLKAWFQDLDTRWVGVYDGGVAAVNEAKDAVGDVAHDVQQEVAEGVFYLSDWAFGEGGWGAGVADAVAKGDWVTALTEATLIASLGPYADEFKDLVNTLINGNIVYETKGPNSKGEYMMKMSSDEDDYYVWFDDEAECIRGVNVMRSLGGEALIEGEVGGGA